MSDVYYVRKRGRVNGPFGIDEILRLKNQGRLTRAHELSTDQHEWKPAFEVEEVFKAYVESSDAPASHNDQQPAISRETEADSLQSADWYYVHEGDRLGPVSSVAIATLVNQGDIEANTLVWNEDLPDWTPAIITPQLCSFFDQPETVAAPKINTGQQPQTYLPSTMIYCRGCGSQIHPTAVSCPNCGAVQNPFGGHGGKSRLIYILLALLLGGLLGIHNFYAGRITVGVIQLLVMAVLGWIGVGIIINCVWVIIECITVTTDGNGQPMS